MKGWKQNNRTDKYFPKTGEILAIIVCCSVKAYLLSITLKN